MFFRNCALPDTGARLAGSNYLFQSFAASFSWGIRHALVLESQHNFSGTIAAFGPLPLCIMMAFSSLLGELLRSSTVIVMFYYPPHLKEVSI